MSQQTMCDNAVRQHGYPIITPQCYSNQVTRRCTVTYREGDSDTLDLCDACAKLVRNDAGRHGYKFNSKKIGGR